MTAPLRALQLAPPPPNGTLIESCNHTLWSLEVSDNYTYANFTNDTVIVQGYLFNIYYYDNLSRPVICAYIINTSPVDLGFVLQARVGTIVTILVVTSVSIIHSAALLVTYTLFKEMRTLPGQVIMNLVTAFLVGDLIVVVLWSLFLKLIFSDWIIIVQSYFFSARFVWMCLAGFEMCRHIHNGMRMKWDSKRRKQKLLISYLLIGWGVPLLLIIVMAATHFRSEKNNSVIQRLFGIGGYFTVIIPIGITLLFNVGIVIFVSIIIRRTINRRSQYKALLRRGTPNFTRVFLIILTVLGFGWFFVFILFAIINEINNTVVIILVFLTATQPIFVTIAFLGTKKVIRKYLVLFGCKEEVVEPKIIQKKSAISRVFSMLFSDRSFEYVHTRDLQRFHRHRRARLSTSSSTCTTGSYVEKATDEEMNTQYMENLERGRGSMLEIVIERIKETTV